jgi:hypothetical protein
MTSTLLTPPLIIAKTSFKVGVHTHFSSGSLYQYCIIHCGSACLCEVVAGMQRASAPRAKDYTCGRCARECRQTYLYKTMVPFFGSWIMEESSVRVFRLSVGGSHESMDSLVGRSCPGRSFLEVGLERKYAGRLCMMMREC